MSADETITFQLATHFLPKIALRLEYLFLTVEHACQQTHAIIHHYALKNIIEITKLIGKPELKSRFLKEFMRIEHTLPKSQLMISNTLYTDLFLQIQRLNEVSGRFGSTIHSDLFLQSITLSQTAQHNDIEQNSPQLIYWLESTATSRQHDLLGWLEQLYILYDSVAIYLTLIRHAAQFELIELTNSYYQRSLPPKTSCHMILLRMAKETGIIPKMQLGHHGLTIRMCNNKSLTEIHNKTIEVGLALCQL